MGNKREVGIKYGLRTLAVLALVVILAGCEIPRDTKNVEVGHYDPAPVPVLTAPTFGLNAWSTSTWSVAWTGGEAPFTVAWDFGGGGTNVAAAPGVSPVSQDVTWVDMAAEGTFTVTVTVTDNLGQSNTDTATVNVGTGCIGFTSIDSMNVTGNILTVNVSNTGGDIVTVSIAGYTGMTPDVTSANGPTAVFTFSADDIILGVNSTVDVTADDGYGGTSTDTSPAIFIPGFSPAPDTLYAIPMATSAAIGDPVTIVVYTGATGPFQFMLNVGLVLPSDAEYVAETFNVGAVGGSLADADGVWSDITTAFILGPDMLLQHPGANTEDSLGTDQRFDFNISPLFGTDQPSVEGALFNVQFTFSAAGTKAITFQEFNGVNRTYYTDLGSRTDTFWGNYVDGYVDVS